MRGQRRSQGIAAALACAAVAVLAAASAYAVASDTVQAEPVADSGAAPATTTATPGIDPVLALAAGDDPCRDAPSYRQCWEARFSSLVDEVGAARSLAAVHTVAERFPQVLANCHEYKHAIGQAAATTVASPTEALADDDRACQFGFRHGVLEGFAAHGTEQNLIEAISTLCVGMTGIDYGECLHGLGHAAAVFEADDAVAAVSYCDHLPAATDADYNGCAQGALMEYENSFQAAHAGSQDGAPGRAPGRAHIDDETASQLCTLLADRYAGGCWRRIGILWGPLYERDYAAMLDRCGTEPATDEHRQECGRSVGSWVWETGAGYTSDPAGHDGVINRVITACSQGPSELVGPCVQGVVIPLRGNELWGGIADSIRLRLCDGLVGAVGDDCRTGEAQAEKAYADARAAGQTATG